jgi:catechol 2,3-dioxygenase-like lactoylglutathione lyase family enzyme
MFSHIELNVSDLEKSVRFYLETLGPLGFRAADSADDYARLTDGSAAVIVLCPVAIAHAGRPYHRRGIGLGHFAIAVESRRMVEEMAAHLARLGIVLLGEGMVDLGYRRGYYTLSFEDHDRIMIEVVWHDPYYFAATPDSSLATLCGPDPGCRQGPVDG